jgi:hypothetical protein
MYRARPEGFADLRKYLDDLWGEGLARMKSAAEADDRAQRKGRLRGRT